MATMSDKTGDYEINEKDIDAVLRFLKATDPDNATPEMAIELLEYLQATFHTMAHENLDKLEEIYADLKKQKKNKTN